MMLLWIWLNSFCPIEFKTVLPASTEGNPQEIPAENQWQTGEKWQSQRRAYWAGKWDGIIYDVKSISRLFSGSSIYGGAADGQQGARRQSVLLKVGGFADVFRPDHDVLRPAKSSLNVFIAPGPGSSLDQCHEWDPAR